MDGERFDALTRHLATDGTSRRRLLRGLGGGLAGAVLAAVGGRGAGAAPGGNSVCDAWCHTTFGDTKAAGQCTSAAARGGGACYGCAGPMGQACPAASDACHEVVCDATTGQCGAETLQPYGTACDDGNPLCNQGICCPATGYEVVNGGCFKITSGLTCDGCNPAGTCAGSVVGSDNYLCGVLVPGTNCLISNDTCASGTACAAYSFQCLQPT